MFSLKFTCTKQQNQVEYYIPALLNVSYEINMSRFFTVKPMFPLFSTTSKIP